MQMWLAQSGWKTSNGMQDADSPTGWRPRCLPAGEKLAKLPCLYLLAIRKKATGMIEWLVYLLTGGFAGIVFAFIFALFKVGPGKKEFSFGKAVSIALLITWGGPFAYVEAVTKVKKAELTPVVAEFFRSNDCPLDGSLKYFKVLYATKDSAVVYMVANEPQDWGGSDSPLMKLKLKKSNSPLTKKMNGWEVVKSDVVRSDRLQKDSIVWPPYQ